jgi:hypothetical protein
MTGLIAPLLAQVLASLLAPVLAPAASAFTCDQDAERCEAVPIATPDDDDAIAEPRYATQAVIDCPAPVADGVLQNLVGECDGTPGDAWYRASRDPESERSPGSLRPARRERGGASATAACAGIPSEGGDAASGGPSAAQPLALFALPTLPRVSSSRFNFEISSPPSSRQLRPLERPPRA